MVGHIFIEQAEAVHDGHELVGLVMGQGLLQRIGKGQDVRLSGCRGGVGLPAYKASRRRRKAQRTPVRKEW